MQKAAINVLDQYDQAVKGFYLNARANLEVHTKTMFDYAIEGDDLM